MPNVVPRPPEMSWEAFRAQFPLTSEYTFLNHAAMSPLPRCAVQAMQERNEQDQFGPKYRKEMIGAVADSRRVVGDLLNASPEEIAFVPNTSTGISLIANGLPLEAGDEVMFTDMEYPANVYPWMGLEAKGVRVRILPNRGGGLDTAMLGQSVTKRTRVVTVSSVQFLSGYRADLAAIGEFCRQRGIYLVVDAIQSLGAIPLDVRKSCIDFLAAGSWKWLLGPVGQGILFCRRELIGLVRPCMTGAEGVVNEGNYLNYDPTPVDTADRFHSGGLSATLIAGLGASARMLLEVGVDRIEQRVIDLTSLLISSLQRRGYHIYSTTDDARRSGIVTFHAPDVEALFTKLAAAKVVVACRWDASGRKYIRVSPHGYNTERDIARLVDELGV